MPLELLLLRLVHILGGIFWLGSGLFTALFLVPALAMSGVNTGQVFAALQQRRMFVALPVVAVAVILSGLRLLSIASAGSAAYFQSTTGRTFAVSGALAILAFVTSLVIGRPANVLAAKLGAAMATVPDHERATAGKRLAAARRRAAVSGTVATVGLVLSGVGMSIARYLP